MIDAYIIRIDNKAIQTEAAAKCLASITKTDSRGSINPFFFTATVPDTIDKHLSEEFKYLDTDRYKWTWPEVPMMDGLDIQSGLYKVCYRAKDQRRVEACLISHMRLWDKCATDDKPMIILEADALFTRQFNLDEVRGTTICGLNDPRSATRRAKVFHDSVRHKHGIQSVPTVNSVGENPVPQGLAGNSAYYITPDGAKKLLDLVLTFGGWPNDAIMCKELIPSMKIIYPYFTKVQGTESTTTG